MSTDMFLNNSIAKHLCNVSIPFWKIEGQSMKFDADWDMFRSLSNYFFIIDQDLDSCLKPITSGNRENSPFFYYENVTLIKTRYEAESKSITDYCNILAIKKNFSYKEDILLSESMMVLKKEYGITWWLVDKKNLSTLGLNKSGA